MLTEKIDSNVIHFYQKAVDKTALIRFTTDFILKIFELFYKKQYSTNPGLESKRIINSSIFGGYGPDLIGAINGF